MQCINEYIVMCCAADQSDHRWGIALRRRSFITLHSWLPQPSKLLPGHTIAASHAAAQLSMPNSRARCHNLANIMSAACSVAATGASAANCYCAGSFLLPGHGPQMTRYRTLLKGLSTALQAVPKLRIVLPCIQPASMPLCVH